MANRTIKVKIIDESNNRMTLYFCSLNRKMPVSKQVFEQRVESGLYEVIE